MGSVYRGHHRETGVEVAIKLIDRAIGEQDRQDFHREVQAHTGLVHPGIVYLFEYGTVPREIEVRAGDELSEASPYVAMELADEGTVRDHMPLGEWPAVYRIVVQVLDGLAHAHARQVIHRDLKPENLLVFGRDDSPDRIKLADFGIAHALTEESTRATDQLASASGTPYYMAPEQTHGRWREFGPWTDLYALGCITWELVCGSPPFQGETAIETMLKHAEAPRPDLRPRFPVPDELEAWIHRAMALEPGDRFWRPADALEAFELLGRPRSSPARGAEGEPRGTAPTDRFDSAALASTQAATLEATRTERAATTLDLDRAPDQTDASPPAEPDDPDRVGDRVVPETWRKRQTDEVPSPLVGTGLGLFDLRETPFVDRDAERDRLWEALRAVERTEEPRVVLVVGESGAGKSALVDWMATRAHELGAVNVMRAIHTRGADARGEGIVGMVKRRLRGYKLDRGEFYEYLLEYLPELPESEVDQETDARALTEFVHPTGDEESVGGPRYRIASLGQKCALVSRLIRRYGFHRPPFIQLDDAQWGDLAMRLVSGVLDGAIDPPAALFAMTLRSDIVAERAHLAEQVEAMSRHDQCIRLDLAPLETDHHRQFVHRLLPLDDPLAERVTDRTEGNPLFAKQLLGALVEAEHLEAGPEGFRLADEASLQLPDDIHQIWLRRLARMIDDLTDCERDEAWRALEWATALGREVDRAEWRAVGAELDLPGRELRDELIERGLAERTDQGWAFAHALLVDSLERHAREHDRWEAHHRRCVELLETVYSEGDRHTAGRRADHWLAAGEPEQALEPLRQEVERTVELGDHAQGREVIDRRRRALDAIDAPADDPRRLENEFEAARFALVGGNDPSEVIESIRQTRRRAEATGEDRLIAQARCVEATSLRKGGNYQAASSCMQIAAESARRVGDDADLPRVLQEWGWIAFMNGRLDSAQKIFSESLHHAERAGDTFRQTGVRRGLATVAGMRGETERAVELFEHSLQQARQAGYRMIVSNCLNGLGDLARFEDELERARECYRRAQTVAEELNQLVSAAVSHANLAQVELAAERFDLAKQRCTEAERRFEDLGRLSTHRELVRLLRAGHAAGVGDWRNVDPVLARLEKRGWPEDALLVNDPPWLLELVGRFAAQHGQRERAERAWRLAADLWHKLDNDEAARRLRDEIGR